MEETKFYTSSEGEKIPVKDLNNFRLVNGLVRNVLLAVSAEATPESMKQADNNVVVLKDEILKRLHNGN